MKAFLNFNITKGLWGQRQIGIVLGNIFLAIVLSAADILAIQVRTYNFSSFSFTWIQIQILDPLRYT